MGGFSPVLDFICVNFIYLLFLSHLDTQQAIWNGF